MPTPTRHVATLCACLALHARADGQLVYRALSSPLGRPVEVQGASVRPVIDRWGVVTFDGWLIGESHQQYRQFFGQPDNVRSELYDIAGRGVSGADGRLWIVQPSGILTRFDPASPPSSVTLNGVVHFSAHRIVATDGWAVIDDGGSLWRPLAPS